jgi:hypothetical protein
LHPQEASDKISKAKGYYHKLSKLVLGLLAIITGAQEDDDDEDDNAYQVCVESDIHCTSHTTSVRAQEENNGGEDDNPYQVVPESIITVNHLLFQLDLF